MIPLYTYTICYLDVKRWKWLMNTDTKNKKKRTLNNRKTGRANLTTTNNIIAKKKM